jgi:hypothetical protein
MLGDILSQYQDIELTLQLASKGRARGFLPRSVSPALKEVVLLNTKLDDVKDQLRDG